MFCDSKNSLVDIVQAFGRPLRLYKGKEKANIIIPVLTKDGDIDKTQYNIIGKVLRALSDADERIKAEIMDVRFGKGKKRVLKPKVNFKLSEIVKLVGFEDELKNSIYIEAISKNLISSMIEKILELKEYGLNYNIHYVWTLRKYYKENRLSKEEITLCESLKGWKWDPTKNHIKYDIIINDEEKIKKHLTDFLKSELSLNQYLKKYLTNGYIFNQLIRKKFKEFCPDIENIIDERNHKSLSKSQQKTQGKKKRFNKKSFMKMWNEFLESNLSENKFREKNNLNAKTWIKYKKEFLLN
jgi:hypothetical protein